MCGIKQDFITNKTKYIVINQKTQRVYKHKKPL